MSILIHIRSKKIPGYIVFLLVIILLITSSTITGLKLNIKNEVEYYKQNDIKVIEKLDISEEYFFNNPIFSQMIIDEEPYTKIDLEDYSKLNTPGKPAIPCKPVRILIPINTEIDNIEIIRGEKSIYCIEDFIEPGQIANPLEFNLDKSINKPNLSIYKSDKVYPENNFEVVTMQYYRGFKIAYIRLYPIQYMPNEDKIISYSSLTIGKIDLKPLDSAEEASQLFRGSEQDFEEVKRYVDNCDSLDSYKKISASINSNNLIRLSSFETQDYDEDFNYLIITTNALVAYNGPNSFQDLCDYRTSRGIKAKIVTIEDIFNDFPGISSQDKIRSFIRDGYINHDLEYVLLAGDDDIVPAQQIYSEVGYGSGASFPSDMFYASLDDDYVAEVYVGRACVGDYTEVSNFVKKTLDYENTNDNYIENALWVGEFLGFGGASQYGDNMKEQSIGSCNEDGYYTKGLPEGGPNGYSVNRLYAGQESWDKNDIMHQLNSGIHLINHCGHANVEYNMKMYNTDIESLSNDNYFFVYSQGCNSGAFDIGDCAAEYFTVKTEHGAFAGIWNVRAGLGREYSTDGPSNRFDREFWDALYNEKLETIGKANHDSKEDNIFLLDQFGIHWCMMGTNLFGDPAVQIRGAGAVLECSNYSFEVKTQKNLVNIVGFDIWNKNPNTMLSYTITENCEWLSVNPTSGISYGEHDTITLTIDTNEMSNGTYFSEIIIDSNVGTKTLDIRLDIGCILSISSNLYEIGLEFNQQGSLDLDIWNDGVDNLDYNIYESYYWLEPSSANGIISQEGEIDTITFHIDSTGLSAGWHKANVLLSSNGGTKSITINLAVEYAACVSTTDICLGDKSIGNTETDSFEIYNFLTGTNLEYNIIESSQWFDVSPSTGTSTGEHDKINIIIDTTQVDACGTYCSDLLISSNGGDIECSVSFKAIYLVESKSSDGTLSTEFHFPQYSYEQAWTADEGIFNGIISLNSSIKEYLPPWYMCVGQQYYEFCSFYTIHRSFLFFDTSTLSNDIEIRQAIINLHGYKSGDFRDNFDIVLQDGGQYPHNPLQVSDYNKVHYTGNMGLLGTQDIVNGQYNSIDIYQTYFNYINRNGITKYCLRSIRDINGISPSIGNEGNDIIVRNSYLFYSSEGVYPPQLIIKYGVDPEVSNIQPSNGAIEQSTNVELSVDVFDIDGNSLEVTFYDDSDDSLIGSIKNVKSNSKASILWNDLDSGSTYSWYVVVSDGIFSTVSETKTFETININQPPELLSPEPGNLTSDVDVSLSELSILVEDSDNSFVNWSIVTIPDVGIANGYSECGIITCPVSGLIYDMLYTWFVDVFDGENHIIEWFSFMTESAPVNNPCSISHVYPLDGQNMVSIQLSDLSVDIVDPEGDSFDWNIECSNGDNSVGNNEYNDTKICSLGSDLDYETTYYWWVNATDFGSGQTVSKMFSFTTAPEVYINNPPDKPVNPSPINNSVNVSINCVLSVDVFDPDGNLLDVSFYLNDDLVDVIKNVISGQSASLEVGLDYNESYSWNVSVFDGEFYNFSDVFVFNTEEKSVTPEEVVVEFTRPVNGMYLMNNYRRSMLSCFVIGDIDIVANISNPDGVFIKNIGFYLDDELIDCFDYEVDKISYTTSWEDKAIGSRVLSVVVSDDEDVIASDELDVFMLNFGIL